MSISSFWVIEKGMRINSITSQIFDLVLSFVSGCVRMFVRVCMYLCAYKSAYELVCIQICLQMVCEVIEWLSVWASACVKCAWVATVCLSTCQSDKKHRQTKRKSKQYKQDHTQLGNKTCVWVAIVSQTEIQSRPNNSNLMFSNMVRLTCVWWLPFHFESRFAFNSLSSRGPFLLRISSPMGGLRC